MALSKSRRSKKGQKETSPAVTSTEEEATQPVDVRLRASGADEALTPEQIESLILDYRANARKLSRSILRRWHARLDIEELDSLVDLALCEAARRYNPTRGASFMTFLFYHLRGCLVRAVDAAANVNAIPAAAFEISELASDYSSVDTYRNGTHRASGNANDIAEALCNQEYMLPDEILYRKELAEISHIACGKLDSLEQEVIYRIYAEEQPLVDIARSLGYSRCHISRVKKRALDVLHEHLSNIVGDAQKDSSALEGKVRQCISRRKLKRRNPAANKERIRARFSEARADVASEAQSQVN